MPQPLRDRTRAFHPARNTCSAGSADASADTAASAHTPTHPLLHRRMTAMQRSHCTGVKRSR